MKKKDLYPLIEQLPKRPGIHGKEKLFNSAVLITLILINDEYNFVFEKRAKGIRQEGEICFPGGMYESDSDDSCMKTAVRETSEELGIDMHNINVLGRLDTIVAAMGATIEPFIGTLENTAPENIVIQETEVEKVFFVPVSWFLKNKPEVYHVALEMKSYVYENGEKKIIFPAKELGLPEKYHNSWGGIRQKVFLYRYKDEVIWGLTAEMVSQFLKLSQQTKETKQSRYA
ncbi:MAG: NUDIX hydrolase [Thermodesulfobacteriota bacterium]